MDASENEGNDKLTGDISFIDWMIGIIKLDNQVIYETKGKDTAKFYAFILIGASIILDVLGLRGFNFRYTIESSGVLSPLYLAVQPLLILLLAVFLSFVSQLLKNKIKIYEAFNLLGAAHLWTLISVLFLPLGSISPLLFLGFVIGFAILYTTTLISGIKQTELQNRILMGILLLLAMVIFTFAIGIIIFAIFFS